MKVKRLYKSELFVFSVQLSCPKIPVSCRHVIAFSSNPVRLLSNFLFLLLPSRKAIAGLLLIVKRWPLHCIYTNPWPLSFIFCVKIDLLKSYWNRLLLILSHLTQVRGSCQTLWNPIESRMMMIESLRLWLKFEIILKHIWMDLI